MGLMADDLFHPTDHLCPGAIPIALGGTETAPLLEEFHGWECIRFLGIHAAFGADCAWATIHPRPHHLGGRSGGRFVNGPTILGLIDASMALISLAHASPAKVATISISASFLNAVPDDMVHCAAVVIKRSRSVIHCQATVFGRSQVSAAMASGILSVLA